MTFILNIILIADGGCDDNGITVSAVLKMMLVLLLLVPGIKMRM